MRMQLVELEGKRTIELTRELTVVGRDEQCDLRLNHKSISKAHCILFRRGAELYLRDLGSTNGTRVNGKRVRRAVLKADDRIAFAGMKFRVACTAAASAAGETEHTQQLDARELMHLLRRPAGKPAAPPRNPAPNPLPDVYPE